MPIELWMKVLLFLLAFAVHQPEPTGYRAPDSVVEGDACEPDKTAREILQGKKTIRPILFHYGKKEILLKNVALGTVSPEDWDDFIMGTKTRFHLKRFRRGLYGTELVESADRFASSTYDWLMEIQLNPSCLAPERLATVKGITRSPAFKYWYQSKPYGIELKDWKTKCFYRNGDPDESQFSFYGKEKNILDDRSIPESICEKVVGDFFEEKRFALIQDHAGDLTLSWALRDRTCIHAIVGSPAHWAREFAYREEFWKNQCSANRNRNHRNNVRVWFAAMAEAGYRMKDLEHFSRMIQTIPKPEPKLIDRALDEVDEFAAHEFAVTLEQVGRRCEKAGKKRQFQTVLGGIASNIGSNKGYEVGMQTSDLKFTLESACR
jgi:hypothetical protein